MTTAYEKRYAGYSPADCDKEAMRLMNECMVANSSRRKWEDVADRLIELRKVKGYAPAPELKGEPV